VFLVVLLEKEILVILDQQAPRDYKVQLVFLVVLREKETLVILDQLACKEKLVQQE
jgi:hypothetical protein